MAFIILAWGPIFDFSPFTFAALERWCKDAIESYDVSFLIYYLQSSILVNHYYFC